MNLFNRVRKLRPNVSVDDYVIQDDGDGQYIAVWSSSEKKPTDDEINGQDDTPSAADYVQSRQVAYAAMGDQLDMLFHDMTAGKGDKTGDWYAAIAKVKSDYPKPD